MPDNEDILLKGMTVMKKKLIASVTALSTLFGTAAMADAPETSLRPQQRPDHIVQNAAIDKAVVDGVVQDVRDGMRRRAINDAVDEAVVSTVVASVIKPKGL